MPFACSSFIKCLLTKGKVTKKQAAHGLIDFEQKQAQKSGQKELYI